MLIVPLKSGRALSSSEITFSVVSLHQRLEVGWGKKSEKNNNNNVATAFTSSPKLVRDFFFPWPSSHWGTSLVHRGIPGINRASGRLLAYRRIGRRMSTNTASPKVGASK